MRVLVVGTNHPPHHKGGYELHCRATVRHLRRRGHEVRVLTSDQRVPGPAHPEEPGVFRELRSFPVRPVPTSELSARRDEHHNAAVLRRHLDAFRPDAVSWWRMAELSMSLIERAGLPAVGMVCDGWMLEGPERDPVCRRAPGYDAAARWLFVSSYLRDAVTARIPLGRTGVAHAGIDLARLPFRGPGAWGGRLLFAGRETPAKGVDVAIGAAERCGLPLTRASRVPHDRMAATFHAADALLFPSRWEEPWGLLPLEAMACGLPVVATGTGGSSEYLRHERNCLIAEPEADAFAAAIRRLAGDPELRARLAAGGRATAEQHPQERWAEVVRQALLAEVRREPVDVERPRQDLRAVA